LYIKMKKFFNKNRVYDKDEFIDDWYFDIGYHYAYVIIIFTLVFIFSASAPLIPVFGFFFFLFKYYIDKYNFIFVYPYEFETRGIFAKSVSNYSTLGLFLF
jgi:hypothetical protein